MFVDIYNSMLKHIGDNPITFTSVSNAAEKMWKAKNFNPESICNVAELVLMFDTCHHNPVKMRETLTVIWNNHYAD